MPCPGFLGVVAWIPRHRPALEAVPLAKDLLHHSRSASKPSPSRCRHPQPDATSARCSGLSLRAFPAAHGLVRNPQRQEVPHHQSTASYSAQFHSVFHLPNIMAAFVVVFVGQGSDRFSSLDSSA